MGERKPSNGAVWSVLLGAAVDAAARGLTRGRPAPDAAKEEPAPSRRDRTPIWVAMIGIIAATAAALVQGQEAIGNERSKLENALILKALDSNDPEEAKARLQFFSDLGLLKSISPQQLAKAKSGRIPLIPTSTPVVAQSCLQAQGFSPGMMDGIPGPRTIQAITTFQQAKGLPATGKLDPATQQALAAACPGSSGTATGAAAP